MAAIFLVACGSDDRSYEADDLLGALDTSAALEDSEIACIDDERLGVTFVLTVDALFQCTNVEQRRVALTDLFDSSVDLADLDGLGLPEGFDAEGFTTCVSTEIGSADDADVDAVWRSSTSSESLGGIAVTTAATACYSLVTSSLIPDDAVTSASVFERVLDAAGFDVAAFTPVVIEQEAAVLEALETPLSLVTISSVDGAAVLSAELRVPDPPSEAEVGAVSGLLAVFGFDDVDVDGVLGQVPGELTATQYRACVAEEVEGIGVRILPLGIGCEQ